MKIVYCHNYYKDRGGEDISFENDLDMLRGEGHTVVPFTRHNDDIAGGSLSIAAKSIWNQTTRTELLATLRREKPDLLQCNNLFPQISMSIYGAARQAGVPVVEALRNYRAFCSNSFFYRDGRVCTDCLKWPGAWKGVVHRCYRDSVTASASVATLQFTQRLTGIRRRGVDAFVTPSEFSRQKHIEGGFDPNDLFVRPNFIFPDLGPRDPSTPVERTYALFVGRLSTEKGILTLIDAWQNFNIPIALMIVGGGSMEAEIREKTAGDDRFILTGQLDSPEVLQRLAQAKMLIMPSQWYETFGRTIAEAFSRGTPVVASRLGAMSELVSEDCGRLFAAGDDRELASAVNELLHLDDDSMAAMRNDCRRRYENNFSRRQSYRRLLEIYQIVFSRRGETGKCVAEVDERLHQLAVVQ